MCLALYVGTTCELALQPWSEGSEFGVHPLHPDDEAVRGHLALPEVRELIAWEGCGCGFARGEFPLTDDDDREKQRRNDRSLAKLAEFLAETLRHEPSLHLYACWMADEALPVQSVRHVRLAHFGARRLIFNERQLLVVSP